MIAVGRNGRSMVQKSPVRMSRPELRRASSASVGGSMSTPMASTSRGGRAIRKRPSPQEGSITRLWRSSSGKNFCTRSSAAQVGVKYWFSDVSRFMAFPPLVRQLVVSRR